METKSVMEQLGEVISRFTKMAAETESAKVASRSLQVVAQAVELGRKLEMKSDSHLVLFLQAMQELDGAVSRSDLYSSYLEFCGHYGSRPVTRVEFYRFISAHCQVFKSGSVRKVLPPVGQLKLPEGLNIPKIEMPETMSSRRRKQGQK